MPKLAEKVYLGIDIGSVSTNFILLDPQSEQIVWKEYLRTQGAPLAVLQTGLKLMQEAGKWEILGVGTTGSGRALAGAVLGADSIKNEITAHAVAALKENQSVQTIIEIGGQDSKLIVLRDGVVVDFSMNTVCAAGTGSFLDQQAARLNVPIEELGALALQSKQPVRIAGRCTVFAESDMIHKQQLGHAMEDILAGLCIAMVRNYLTNVAKGKEAKPAIFFQGGVAANLGMQRFLEEALGCEIHVPTHFDVMGAIGAAYLAKETLEKKQTSTNFVGYKIFTSNYTTESYECKKCPNNCEVTELWCDGQFVAGWGRRCGL